MTDEARQSQTRNTPFARCNSRCWQVSRLADLGAFAPAFAHLPGMCQWRGDLSGHGRGGGCGLADSGLSHSLFACPKTGTNRGHMAQQAQDCQATRGAFWGTKTA